MAQGRFDDWHRDLVDLLGLAVPPVGIAFVDRMPPDVEPADARRLAGDNA